MLQHTKHQVKLFEMHCYTQPHSESFSPPHPKGTKEGRPWLRLITCRDDKFVFMGGVPIYQSIVLAGVCYIQNRLSRQPWKALSILQRRFVMCIFLGGM